VFSAASFASGVALSLALSAAISLRRSPLFVVALAAAVQKECKNLHPPRAGQRRRNRKEYCPIVFEYYATMVHWQNNRNKALNVLF
tara:strand:+ start:110 stop:367 length:258 start_codon:yes stop_codon:yes gene_type:complete